MYYGSCHKVEGKIQWHFKYATNGKRRGGQKEKREEKKIEKTKNGRKEVVNHNSGQLDVNIKM